MIKHILTWFFKSVFTLLVGLPVTILSPLVTAIALPFRVEYPETDTPFTDPRFADQGFHRLVTLPKWAKWWDNIYDGMWGDTRGWWNNYCLENHNKDCRAFLSMWLWNGVRNPANWFGRHVKGIDVSECDIIKLAGQDVVEADKGLPGWQFLVADRVDGKLFHRFFLELPWFFKPDRLLLIDIGWKIKLSHNNTPSTARPQDRFKGSVFTVSPWKSL